MLFNDKFIIGTTINPNVPDGISKMFVLISFLLNLFLLWDFFFFFYNIFLLNVKYFSFFYYFIIGILFFFSYLFFICFIDLRKKFFF
jgi:hypothetical protein